MKSATNISGELLKEQWIKEEKRKQLGEVMQEAQIHLDNFKITISVRKKLPTLVNISFTHQQLSKFDTLKNYVGGYGFVVPVQGTPNKKILKGEKPFKFRTPKNDLKNTIPQV